MADMTENQSPNFLQFLARFDRGALIDRLTDESKDLVAWLEQLEQDHSIQKSKGTLTLKLTFKREKGRYELDADIDVKKPKLPAASEIMWATPNNSLVPENPKQQKFAFTEVVTQRGQA